MHKLRTIVPYDVNDRARDECETDIHVKIASDFLSLSR